MEEELIKESCESTECPIEIEPIFPLWVINYKVIGDKPYAGLAIVKALDCHMAENIFKSKSAHNGNPENIRIMEVKEVYTLPCPDLLAEEYIPFIPPQLPPQKKIGNRK